MIADLSGKGTLPPSIEVRSGDGDRMRDKGAIYNFIRTRRTWRNNNNYSVYEKYGTENKG